jgi:hypothetical protein
MIQQIEESARQLLPEDIRRIESLIGMRLPVDYVTFMLKYNGGYPIPSAFPIEGFVNNPFGVIQVFFGIDRPIESSNLDWNFETFNGRIPANLFPIACDDGGDLICLSLFGEDAGAVLFWDCYAESSEPSYENVYRIASSFQEFVDGIIELPEE